MPAAEFNRGDRPACLEGTRESILRDVMAWALDRTSQPVFWLNGMVGTGKTTIAESFSRQLHAKGILAGSFFFWRSGPPDRREIQNVLPSLAVSIARQFPGFLERLLEGIKSEPGIASMSLEEQISSLIIKPFDGIPHTENSPKLVLVIDALDECDNASRMAQLVDIILAKAPTCQFKFFLTSRPESGIMRAFDNGKLRDPWILRLQDVEDIIIKADIRRYYESRLTEARIYDDALTTRSPSDPFINVFEDLVYRTGRLFAAAAAVCEYITRPEGYLDPMTRVLEFLQGVKPSEASIARLDSPYSFILKQTKYYHGTTERKNMQNVLYCVVYSHWSFTVAALAQFLDISNIALRISLQSLHSVLCVPSIDSEGHIMPFHASFTDYLKDISRSGEHHINPERAHDYLLQRCLATMNSGLHFNMLDIRSSFFGVQCMGMEDLRRKNTVLVYSCIFWVKHLNNHSCSIHQDVIECFQEKVLFWLEVIAADCSGTKDKYFDVEINNVCHITALWIYSCR